MASGNFISSTGTNLNLYVTWSSTADVSTNKSSVTAKVYMRSYTISGSALTDSYITINGNKKSFAGKSLTKTSNTLTDTLLAEHTVSVDHGSDGKKSITITANLEFNGTVSGKYLSDITASKTVALDSIPRASGLSVATSVNTGSSLTATISPASSAFTHKISYIIGNTTMFTSDAIPANTKIYAKTIEHSWLPALTSANMVVRLFTYSSSTQNDSTKIGVTDESVTVNVPADIKATVSNLKATVVNGLGGYYVEGKSKVKLEATAAPGAGSSLTSYVFSGPNISGSSSTYTSTSSTVTSSAIKSIGELTYGVVAKDRRTGRDSDKKTVKINVEPYAEPQITSITAQRCKSDGTLDDNGTYARVVIKTSHSPVNAANYITVKLSNSLNSTQTDVAVKSYTKESNNVYTVVKYGGSFAINSSYTITATITDNYNTGTTLTKSTTLKAAKRTLNIAKYGNGVSIGGLSTVTSSTDAGKFECNWDALHTDSVRITSANEKYFEVTRTGMSDDINQDGVEDIADIRGQLYINESGNVTLRRRYSTDNGATYTTQGYWQLQDNRSYVSNDFVVGGEILSSHARFNGTTDASPIEQNNVPLRIGNPSGDHLDIDGNEIIAKDSPTETGTLGLVGTYVDLMNGSTTVLRTGIDTTSTYVQSLPTYNRTYTNAANIYITTAGTFGRSTASSERYKKDIEDVSNEDLNPYKILDIPVRQFRYNEENVPVDGKPDDLYIGLIAEEVNEVYPIATEYTEDGQIEMWNIKMLFPALLKIVQDQQKEIDALKAEINNIKNTL